MLAFKTMTRLSSHWHLAKRITLTVLLCTYTVQAQTANTEGKLTIEEVVRLTHDHLAEDILVTKIKKNAKPFDLSSDELLDLKKEGVSDTVIKYLLDPSLPYAPAPPPPNPVVAPTKTSEPGRSYPPDAYASRIPPGEPGLYFFSGNTPAPAKVDLKFLLGSVEAKSLMKKGKTLAFLVGPSASTHLQTSTPVFYIRLAEGKEIEELVLVDLLQKNGRRELDLGPKQELKAEDIHQRDLLEVGPHLFRIKPAKLEPGEYLFFFIGSAEPAKGVFGKGYDFSVEAQPSAKKK
jgi:hypothetical protein